MKPFKLGQFRWIGGRLYRISRRTDGCQGCALDNIWTCPAINDKRYEHFDPQCAANGIIFTKV